MSDRRTLTALLLLGFASGLPVALAGGVCFETWLAKRGFTATDIAFAGAVSLPYALKALWAPLVDRWTPPGGRRRGWLAMTQVACALGILALAGCDPQPGDAAALLPVLLAAGCVAVASATQDLALGGLTAEVLSPTRMAMGAGLSVWGWRVAFLVSGGLALNLAAVWGWPAMFLLMAALMVVGAVGTLLATEPAGRIPPASLRAAVVVPFQGFRAHLGWGGIAVLVAFLLLYKLPDGLAGLVLSKFQADRFDLASLGLSRSLAGLLATGIGTVAAGWAAARWGTIPCLWVGSLLMAASNLAWVGIDQGWLPGLSGLIIAVLVDNACAAAAGTALVAHLLAYCSTAAAATQYAILTAVMALSPHLLRPLVVLQPAVGWSGWFLASCLAVLPGLFLLALLARTQRHAGQGSINQL